jgi:hypothetical protein
MKYCVQTVTSEPELWRDSDPIHPTLGAEFKTAQGREVFGLKGADGKWKAFMCLAITTDVPRNLQELEAMTDSDGTVVVPYSVWSFEKGAGREMINEVLWFAKTMLKNIQRVVTLSPQTEMAERFHLRNGAAKFRTNEATVNFEYAVRACIACGCDPCDCDWGVE